MKFVCQITIPNDKFNELVKEGSAGRKLSQVMEETHPEAIYFSTIDGQRGCYAVYDLDDPSQLPRIAEPWFLTFNSTIEPKLCMTPDDLQKAGLDDLGRKYR